MLALAFLGAVPTAPPIDVMLIILAVIMAASVMEDMPDSSAVARRASCAGPCRRRRAVLRECAGRQQHRNGNTCQDTAFAKRLRNLHETRPKFQSSKNQNEDSPPSQRQFVGQWSRLRKFTIGLAGLRAARFRPLCQSGNIYGFSRHCFAKPIRRRPRPKGRGDPQGPISASLRRRDICHIRQRLSR